MKSFLFQATSLVLLAVTPAGLRASDLAPAPGRVEFTTGLIDRLLLEAQRQNPALQAAGARAEAANATVAAVRTWEDPTASFGLWAPTSKGFQSSEQGNLIYGISQKLPLHGVPDLKRKVAAADASREQFAEGYETQRLRRDLGVALADLALSGREAEIAGQDLGWLDAAAGVGGPTAATGWGRRGQVDWL